MTSRQPVKWKKGRYVPKEKVLFGPDAVMTNLLMLLPEDLRRQVARIIWWDLPDILHRKCSYVKQIAEIHKPDGPPTYSDEDLLHALLVVGYPEGSAKWRVIRHEANLRSYRVWKKPCERERLQELGMYFEQKETKEAKGVCV